MAQKVYKSPLEQARADFDAGKISQGQLDDVAIAEFEKNKVPPFNKDASVSYWRQYGDGFTDDAYEQWAKGKGKTLGPRTPLNPGFAKTQLARQSWFDPEHDGTYKDQYLKDDEWLQESWPDIAQDAIDYYENWEDQQYDDIDDDYERSYGPVNTRAKYKQYQEWLKGGK